MKFKIYRRRGLSLRKPWMLVYPTGGELKFKTFDSAIVQLKLLKLWHDQTGNVAPISFQPVHYPQANSPKINLVYL